MAYIQQQLDDEERKKQQEQGAGAPLAEQAGAPASGGTVAPAKDEGATGGGGGVKRFTDVRSFLEANRPQAQELAQRVGQKIKTEAQGVQQDIEKSGEQFRGQVEQGAVRKEPVAGLIQEAFTRPEDVVKRQEDVQKLAKVRSAQFTGPQTLRGTQDYASLQNRLGEAQRKAGLTETQAGREELLGLTGRPSTGGLMLDQLLLSQTPEARAALQEAGQSTAGLGQTLESTVAGGEEFAKQAAQETEATKALFGEQFGKAKTEFQKQLEDRLNQVRQQALSRAEKAKGAALGQAPLDEQALADLGVGAQDLQAILQAQKDLTGDYGFNRDIADYLQQQGANYNINEAATSEDLARQRALEELAGQEFGPLSGNVGGANLNLSQFAGQSAREGTVGTLSAKDRALIDQYYNREDLGEGQKALKNALRREAEYAKGKTFAPKEPGPSLTDVIMTDPLTGINMGDLGKKLEPIQETAKNVEEFVTTPARQVRDEINRTVDSVKDALGSNVTEPVKEALKVLDPREQIEAVKEIAKDPVKAVEKVAQKVENTVKKIFCFVAGTMIKMESGVEMDVVDIGLGSACAIGGEVYSIRQSLVDETIYDYFGVRVTGDHAVCEEGQWIRVKSSKHAIPVAFKGTVYSIANDNHRLVINGILFADELETDDYEKLSIDESLVELNQKNGAFAEVN